MTMVTISFVDMAYGRLPTATGLPDGEEFGGWIVMDTAEVAINRFPPEVVIASMTSPGNRGDATASAEVAWKSTTGTVQLQVVCELL